MSNTPQAKVKEHYPAYQKFLEEKKTIEHNQLKVDKRPKSTRNNMIGSSPVIYSALEDWKKFEIEISVEDKRKYKLRIFANWFCECPCFRFDAAGRAHCNRDDGSGLPKRRVLTPHFQKFSKEGVEYAYKSVKLLSEFDSNAIVGDYRLGLEHFCQEANLACNQTAHPELVINQTEFDLSSDDPLNGVNFS